MKRFTIYDSIKPNTKLLAGTLVINNNQMKKSREEGGSIVEPDNLKAFTEVFQKANVIASEIWKAYACLKEDYATGEINQVRYKEYLQPLKEFFQIADIAKSDIPVSMGARDILKEISKHLG